MRACVAAFASVICAAGLAAAQRGARPDCEPPVAAGAVRSVTDLLASARCYDEQWRFGEAERLLAASLTALTSELASATDVITPGGALFVGGDVVAPAQTNAVVGDYPQAALTKGAKGQVIVEVVVGRDGKVRQAKVIESIPDLDAPALASVRKIRFAPTLVAGNPVEVSFFVPARFGLAADPTPVDWIDLARAYYTHGHPAAAVPVVATALTRERDDVARFGSSWVRVTGISRTPGEGITEPKKVRHVNPQYPPWALKARIQGMVIMEALIDTAGAVGRTRVLRGASGLEGAAVDAVSQWTYTPTLVGGKPAPIVLTVSVTFTVTPARRAARPRAARAIWRP